MEKLSRDPMLIILSNLDDKDLLNFSKTNKKGYELCKNEDFWRNRFVSRYGENSKFFYSKDSNDSKGPWKDFYLKIVHYLNLAKNNINEAMKLTAMGGHLDIVKFFIEKGAYDWNSGMKYAAEGGHLDIIKFFIEKGAWDWNYGMGSAAFKGHLNIVNFFIEQGANDWNYGMGISALRGDLNLVKFFIEKGANNWYYGLKYAEREGNLNLLNFFIEKIQKERRFKSSKIL